MAITQLFTQLTGPADGSGSGIDTALTLFVVAVFGFSLLRWTAWLVVRTFRRWQGRRLDRLERDSHTGTGTGTGT